jgi:hypothetical protein
MSDTKWRKALSALETADAGLVQMVVKFIDVDEPHIMVFPPNLDHCPKPYMDTIEFGPTELRSIEWLEFRSQAGIRRLDNLPAKVVEQDINRAAEVVNSLGQYPVELTGSALRIVGYRR